MASGISDRETVLQFGAGRFLRGFVDRFIATAIAAGDTSPVVGNICIVQSTPGTRAQAFAENRYQYPVAIRGILNEAIVDEVQTIQCVTRALVADEDWNEVEKLAESPQLKLIVTNSTEAGFTLDPSDKLHSQPPKTLPAKLTAVLWRKFHSEPGRTPAGLTILPCELIQNNADALKSLVLEQAARWDLDPGFTAWADQDCNWLNNLVDCIVSDLPADDPRRVANSLAIQAEPYALLAIKKQIRGAIPFFDHPAVKWVDDLDPYYLRKVRILNGLHSAMVAKFYNVDFAGRQLQTVQEIMQFPAAQRWVKDVLFEEILPVIANRVSGAAEFAEATLDRFRNPFLSHKLSDISLNHAAKVKVRLQPTVDEYQSLYGTPPRLLAEIIQRTI